MQREGSAAALNRLASGSSEGKVIFCIIKLLPFLLKLFFPLCTRERNNRETGVLLA